MTILQAVSLANQAESLFERAARAWVTGANSGNDKDIARYNKKCSKLRREAEALLKPLGIEMDYPGLYPSFKVKGYSYHSVLSAVSAALE